MSDLRQACDRCHSKKLRCTKIPGSSVCTRCVKAGVTCLFSPPSRSLRHPDNAAFDWSILDLDTAIDPILGMHRVEMITPPVVEETDLTPSTQAKATETSQLTDMMAALDHLQESWPTSERQHLSVKELNEYMRASNFDLGSYLEELLQRAQELVHLYPEVLERLEPKDSACAIPECIHNTRQYSQPKSRPPIDQSLINLLLACHIRTLDLFDHIIFHGHMCASAVPFLPKDHEPQLDIPEIKIGSFVAPKVSAASMMIAMFIELQSSLTAKVQQLHDTISSAAGHESREAKILGLQCESLKERALANVPNLQSLRDNFLKLGLIG